MGYDQPQRIEEDRRLVKPSPQTRSRLVVGPALPAHLLVDRIDGRVEGVDVGLHDATGFPARIAKLAFPTSKPGLLDLVLHVRRDLLLVFFDEDGDGEHVALGSNVAGPTTSITDEVWVPLAPISVRADKTPARVVRRRGPRATVATAGGEGAGLETTAPPVVTTITALARRWAVTTAGVQSENTRGALDGDVKLPGGRLASETVGPWEDRVGTELGRFVELVRKTFDTQGRGQIAIIVHREVVVNASEESSDDVGESIVVDCLEERGAARFVIVELALFGEKTIVKQERVGKIKDTVVGPGRERDGDSRIKSRDCEFENAPQEVVPVVRLHTDHVDNGGNLVICFREEAGQEFQEDASRDRVAGETGARDA